MRNPTIKPAPVTGLRASRTAFAGPHADELSRCFVESTTREDRKTRFPLLGQVAGKELFPSPQVAMATSGLARHFDGKQLESLARRAH